MINIFGLPQTSSATSSQVPNEPEFVESADWLTQLGSSLEISKPFTLPKVMVERFGTYEEAVLTVHKASILDVTFRNGDRYQLRLNRRYLKEWVIRSSEPLPRTMLVVPIDGSLPRPILVTFNTEADGEGTSIGNYFGSGLDNLSLCNDVLYSGELTELVAQENGSNISFSRLEERPTHTSEVVLPLNDFSFEAIGPESAFTEGAHN